MSDGASGGAGGGEPDDPGAAGARARALAFLGSHHVATIATAGGGGPWAAAVFYACRGFRLLFLSSSTSRHARALALDPRAAATVQAEHLDWRELRGLQLEGTVRELAGAAADDARRLFGARFPIVGRPGEAPPEIAQALARARWYELAPSRVLFVDNAAGFGHRDEIAIDG